MVSSSCHSGASLRLNCASLGYPDLQPTAFTAANADALPDQGARDHVNSPRSASIEDGRLVVSSIHVWFADDFGGEAGVLDHLRRYAEPALAAELAAVHAIA